MIPGQSRSSQHAGSSMRVEAAVARARDDRECDYYQEAELSAMVEAPSRSMDAPNEAHRAWVDPPQVRFRYLREASRHGLRGLGPGSCERSVGDSSGLGPGARYRREGLTHGPETSRGSYHRPGGMHLLAQITAATFAPMYYPRAPSDTID